MSNQPACTIDIRSKLNLAAVVKSWLPFHIHLTVGHRRLAVLTKRIDAAERNGDRRAAAIWAADRERLVRILAGRAAFSAIRVVRSRRTTIDTILTLIFTASTLLYTFNITAAIVIDVILVASLWVVTREFNARERYIYDLIDMSFGRNGTAKLIIRNAREGADG